MTENIGVSGERKSESVDKEIELRKEKLMVFIKKNYNWAAYLVLAFLVFLSIKIRTSNLPILKDITTNDWTLGPDLDPFLFLRWAKYIVANGSLFALDKMRYMPFGLKTDEEYLLHPYLIAWFHNVFSLFGSESVTYSAIIFPVFMFALTVIAFFFLSRKIFLNSLGEKKANIIGLISSFFLVVMPALLPRTIAGIPEKEASGFLFMFLAFYFFLVSWDSNKNMQRYSFAVLAGLATSAMAMVWGGYIFIFITIAPAVLLSFMLGQVDKNKIYGYATWFLSAFVVMNYFSIRYPLISLFSSIYTLVPIVVLITMLVHLAIFNTRVRKYLDKPWISKSPPQLVSLILTFVILTVLATIFFGPSFIQGQIQNMIDNLVKPATSRLIQTVAENSQPYFADWAGNFGPIVKNIQLAFYLFFIGSIFLFYESLSSLNKKRRAVLTLAYSIFIISMAYSRYSASGALNGENFVSLSFYALGFLLFSLTSLFYYCKHYQEKSEVLKRIDFGMIFLTMMFLLGLVSARSAVRLVMVLVAPASIILGFFVVHTYSKAEKSLDSKKTFAWVVFARFYLRHSLQVMQCTRKIAARQVYMGLQFTRTSGRKQCLGLGKILLKKQFLRTGGIMDTGFSQLESEPPFLTEEM